MDAAEFRNMTLAAASRAENDGFTESARALRSLIQDEVVTLRRRNLSPELSRKLSNDAANQTGGLTSD